MQAYPAGFQWGSELAAIFTFVHNSGLIWVFFLAYLVVGVWYHIWVIRQEGRDYDEIADRVRKGGH